MRLATGQCGCMDPEAKSPHIFCIGKSHISIMKFCLVQIMSSY